MVKLILFLALKLAVRKNNSLLLVVGFCKKDARAASKSRLTSRYRRYLNLLHDLGFWGLHLEYEATVTPLADSHRVNVTQAITGYFGSVLGTFSDPGNCGVNNLLYTSQSAFLIYGLKLM